MSGAWYSEIDPKAAATLRELIREGHIADGDVDERSIEDVAPAELVGYTQRHFFAGAGIWSLGLRNAGWPDDRAVVTMSCPCQPFSAAGKGGGFADERHLWPAGYWHIALGEPCPVFGEQVASDDGLAWLDVVCADLEDARYAVGALDLCAAGFGAPHIRQRLYWMAQPQAAKRRWTRDAQHAGGRAAQVGGPGVADGLADADPSARDWKDTAGMAETGTNPDGSERTRLDQLPRQAQLVGWTTPSASDGERGGSLKQAQNTHRPSGAAIGSILTHQAQLALVSPARRTVSGELLTGSCAVRNLGIPTDGGGQLSPEHSLWLMGIPSAWACCASRAMRSLSRRRGRSSPRQSK